jgi:hypothetical protein
MKRLTKEEKQLLKKLENAYTVCSECGDKYGVYSVGCSSVWNGTCNVCDQETHVTEARDYAYLMTGIRKLKLGGIKSMTSEFAQTHGVP